MLLRHIKLGLVALTALVGATSCLDKYPDSAIPEKDAMQTFADAEQHLIGIYGHLMNSALYSGYLTLLPDIQCDLAYAVEGNSNTYGDFWLWKIRPTDLLIQDVYAQLYAVIGACNFYLDRIDAVMARETSDANLETLDQYTGEVYAIRALCYSELLKCFCEAYDPATAEQQQGVVLRTKYFEKEPVRRATLYDSYKFVLDDLTRADELLDDAEDTPNNYYMSEAAVQAIRARVALYMQDWDAAIEYSSILLDDKKDTFHLASFQETAADGASTFDYMWAYDEGPEVIWRIGFTSTSYGGALGTVFLNFNRDDTYFYPDYVPAQWVLDAYEESDLRSTSYFADSESGITIGYANGLDWPLLVKYYGNRAIFIPQRIFQVSMPKPLRLAEQYLIRAEAYCRKASPDPARAQKDLEALRKTRFASGGTISLTGDWATDVKTFSEERVRELYMEGFRLQDLKRWGLGFERTPQSCTQDEGNDLKIEAGDPLFVWPIPQHELEAPGSEITPNESNK